MFFGDARFSFFPKPDQILPNLFKFTQILLKFNQILPKFAKKNLLGNVIQWRKSWGCRNATASPASPALTPRSL